MSNDRPRGSYNGPLSLQWCAYSMTVRAMPMNYLAADLSRIDAALWGRESEIGAAIAEAPAMMQRLFYLVDAVDEFERNPTAGTQSMLRSRAKAARAILSRIDGAGDTLPDAPVPGLWRIVQYDPAGDVTLYWSNANGWGGLARSDGYSQAEREALNLPMGGQWWFDRDDDSDLPAPSPTGELVTVRADHLSALVEAAGKYADDLETGLEDGTYEDRADLDAVKAAIAAVQGEA